MNKPRYFRAQSRNEVKTNFVVRAKEVREENGVVFEIRGPFKVQSYRDFAKHQGKRIRDKNTPVLLEGLFDLNGYSLRELKRCPSGLGEGFRKMKEALAK